MSRRVIVPFFLFVPGVSLMAACSAEAPAPEPQGLALEVAPLSLEGIDFACYDLRVTAGTGAQTQTVWQKGDPAFTRLGHDQNLAPSTNNPVAGTLDAGTLCSSQYGNGDGGDLTYIGPCDAQADTSAADGVQNDVTLWFDGLYVGTDQAATELGDWRDPCGSAGCTLSFDCNENRDTLVRFDFTVMRDASQGFFDVAVNFEDIFCSAKVDCSYDANGASPIELLFDADGNRAQTAVAALACTAGPGADTGTVLHMNGARVECAGSASPGMKIALPVTCIGDDAGGLGEAFGLAAAYGEDANGDGQFLSLAPAIWQLDDGSYDTLPLPVGAVGGAVQRRIDDTTLVGYSVDELVGEAMKARPIMWRKVDDAWTIGSVAPGEAFLVELFEGFECTGDYAAGFCWASTEDYPQRLVRWDWSGGVFGAGAVIANPGAETNCADLRFNSDFANGINTDMGVRTCFDQSTFTARAYAYFPGTATYVALTAPANLPSASIGHVEPFSVPPTGTSGGPLAAVGTVNYSVDAGQTYSSTVVYWRWDAATEQFGVSSVADPVVYPNLKLRQVHDGALVLYNEAKDILADFDGSGSFTLYDDFEYSADGIDFVDVARLEIDGHVNAAEPNGFIWGRYALAGGLLVPFYAFPGNADEPVRVIPLTIATGDAPTADARYHGSPWFLSAGIPMLRVHYILPQDANDPYDGPALGYVYELVPTGTGESAYTRVEYPQPPNDFIGVFSSYASLTTVELTSRFPSCASLIGSVAASEFEVGPAFWTWPPGTDGELAAMTSLDLPGGRSGGSASAGSVDLDPTVIGNGYTTPRTGEIVWQYGIYKGEESLDCGGVSCNKIYWNTAIGFDPTRPDCKLILEATAAPAPGLSNNQTPADSAAWPVITMNVPLTASTRNGVEVVCRQNPLNGTGSGVTTTYTQPGQVVSFCHRFDGTAATSSADCDWTPITVSGPLACSRDFDCDDNDLCTQDLCDAGVCGHIRSAARECGEDK